MLITRTLFATRARRVAVPLLCLILAATAIVVGSGLGVVVAVGFAILAGLVKVAAELSSRERRLESRIRSARRDLDAAIKALRSAETDVHDADAGLDALATRVDALLARAARIEERQQELDDRMSSAIEALQPVRRYRLVSGDDMADLSLRSSTGTLLRRFRNEGGPS